MSPSFTRWFAIFSFMTIIFISGCASRPPLEKYPRREIERPYTLPDGVNNWHIRTSVSRNRDDKFSQAAIALPNPLIWEIALNDDWTLLWYPINLGISHQFWKNETSRLGFSFLANMAYSSIMGFRVYPTLNLSYRHQLTQKVALDFVPSVVLDFPFKSGKKFHWSTSLDIGPVLQLAENFALKPNLFFAATHGRTALPNATETYFIGELEERTIFVMGLGTSATWSFARQWDLRPTYNYSGFTAENGYEAHFGSLEFVHFW